MTDINAAQLKHINLLLIQGPDAVKFLQGQCTQDINQLEPGIARHGAFCTAKGRAVTNVWLAKIAHSDAIAIICHSTSAPALFKHLSKYIAFFRGTKLSFAEHAYQAFGANQVDTAAINTVNFAEDGVFAVQWGTRTLVWRAGEATIGTEAFIEKLNTEPLDAYRWQQMDIEERRLLLNAEQIERWIPQNFSLDELDGISFKKGCYTGQEVIARLHYKGQSKKRLFAFKAQPTASLELEKVFADGKVIGDVIEQVSNDDCLYGLAILKADAIGAALSLDENQQVAIELLH